MKSIRYPDWNSPVMLENRRLHYDSHAESRASKAAAVARYYADRRERTPLWANTGAIRRVYREAKRLTKLTGIQHHVDHDIPLRGPIASGLHVHANLQIMTCTDHRAKHSSMH